MWISEYFILHKWIFDKYYKKKKKNIWSYLIPKGQSLVHVRNVLFLWNNFCYMRKNILCIFSRIISIIASCTVPMWKALLDCCLSMPPILWWNIFHWQDLLVKLYWKLLNTFKTCPGLLVSLGNLSLFVGHGSLTCCNKP